jgi:hypothetical protein
MGQSYKKTVGIVPQPVIEHPDSHKPRAGQGTRFHPNLVAKSTPDSSDAIKETFGQITYYFYAIPEGGKYPYSDRATTQFDAAAPR